MDSQAGPLSPLHEAARQWAEAGFYVFPCRENEKVPATEHGLHDATTDLDQIDRWWAGNPQFNIGVSPARSSMSVLDVDLPLGDASLKALTDAHGALPATLTIGTPRGGRHYWFQASWPSTVNKLGPKLDTRGEGGYVLVPPSIVNGNPYTYEGETNEIAEAPAWIGSAVNQAREHVAANADAVLDDPANVGRARSLLQQYAGSGRVAIEGQGGDFQTYQVACEVLNLGLSVEKAFEVIADEWNPRCTPPWEPDDLLAKVVNASRYAQNEAGAWAVPPSETLFGEIARNIGTQQRRRFKPMSVAEMALLPEPTWLLENLLPAQSLGMIYGPYESYKSFLTLDLALTLASGLPGWGAAARPPVPVIYAAGEGPRDLARKRAPAWYLANKIDQPETLPFYVVDEVPMTALPGDVLQFVESIKEDKLKPALVILDTAAICLTGMNENDAKDAGLLIHAIKEIRKALDCAVLLVHHTGKDADRGSRGSSAIPAGLDTILEIKADEATRTVSVHVAKQKDADKPKTPWTFQGEVVGPSLVFSEIDAATYRTITGKDDTFSHAKVAAALRELGALSPETGVTTHVLASHLCPTLDGDTHDDRERLISTFKKKLALLAKGKLEAYVQGSGRETRWFIPAAVSN